eukprot:TRINITY_DN19433_c0_g1_i1.p1 TRINITY_DN19433_c0_g1~~TRINITY_DN19433_c0_g1_i1.p1  ORF type:complete len:806 (+),score=184.75 TRINITY_DN19433_c0_g1_i1:62-2479(+)
MACACRNATNLPEVIPQAFLKDLLETTRLKSQEVLALYARFRRLAPGGFLYPEQFKQAMGLLGLMEDVFLPERMFMAFDRNSDGQLDFAEFATSLAVMLRGTEDEKLRLSFEMIAGRPDAKGICLQDFQQLLKFCDATMSTLLVDCSATRSALQPEGSEELFLELIAGDEGARPDVSSTREEPLLSLEAYKAGARGNATFLRRLGLGAALLRTPSHSEESQQRQSPAPAPAVAGPSGIAELKSLLHAALDALPGPTPDAAVDRDVEPLPQRPPSSSWSFLGLLASPLSFGCCASSTAEEQHNWDCPPPEAEACPACNAGRDALPSAADRELDHLLEWCARSRGASTGAGEARCVTAQPAAQKCECGGAERLTFAASSTLARQRKTSKHPILEKSRSSALLQRRRAHCHRLLGPKKGLAVHFGHENWNMVISMMLGIRLAVGRVQNEIPRDIGPVDFIMKEKFSIAPRLANIFDSTISQKVALTRFIDYAPMVFSRFRAALGISPEEYARSIGPEQLLGNMVLGNLSALSEQSSEGKSGAFFYYTADGRYMMKTVTRKEHRLLKQILPAYYEHVKSHPQTLLVRFLGMHALEVREHGRMHTSRPKQKLYFVVMANVFNAPVDIHRRYDLKGSWIGRSTTEPGNPGVALKDVDFTRRGERLEIAPPLRDALLAQVKADSNFLRDCGIIDYSLLVGIHEQREMVAVAESAGAEAAAPAVLPTGSVDAASGLSSVDGRATYFLGIIDILTPYDSSKKLEHLCKALLHNSRGVSCCPPQAYADRFQDFMKKAFPISECKPSSAEVRHIAL